MSSISHAADENQDLDIFPEMVTVEQLKNQLDHIQREVNLMRTSMDDTERMVRALIAEVGPVVQEIIPMISNLVEHPMIRMLLKGKK